METRHLFDIKFQRVCCDTEFTIVSYSAFQTYVKYLVLVFQTYVKYSVEVKRRGQLLLRKVSASPVFSTRVD